MSTFNLLTDVRKMTPNYFLNISVTNHVKFRGHIGRNWNWSSTLVSKSTTTFCRRQLRCQCGWDFRRRRIICTAVKQDKTEKQISTMQT